LSKPSKQGIELDQCLPVTSRRPWSAEVQPNYYFVHDADGQQIAYVYYSNDPERRSAAKQLSKDEAYYCGVYLKDTGNRKEGSSC
jgi:hypothetical protein